MEMIPGKTYIVGDDIFRICEMCGYLEKMNGPFGGYHFRKGYCAHMHEITVERKP